MTEEEKQQQEQKNAAYRFSGMQAIMAKLDETGYQYMISFGIPELRNQPDYYSTRSLWSAEGSINTLNNASGVNSTGSGAVTPRNQISFVNGEDRADQISKSKTFPLLKI